MTRRGILSVFLLSVALAGLSSQSAWASTTTLTFDEFPNGTVLTTQYQNVGVTINGATTLASCSTCVFPPVSGSYIAFSPLGVMTLTFASANVSMVSVYITDYDSSVTVTAYDSSNNLLGQSS